jgi:hypothetical protein
VADGVIARFVPFDMSGGEEELYERAQGAIVALAHDPALGGATVHGITTFCELYIALVARLCEAFGLPTSPHAAVEIARNKHATRAAMAAAGLAAVSNALVHSEADLSAAIAKVGFPAVLKPVAGAASLGVKKVYSADQLRDAFAEVRAEMEATVVHAGALVKQHAPSPSTSCASLADALHGRALGGSGDGRSEGGRSEGGHSELDEAERPDSPGNDERPDSPGLDHAPVHRVASQDACASPPPGESRVTQPPAVFM